MIQNSRARLLYACAYNESYTYVNERAFKMSNILIPPITSPEFLMHALAQSDCPYATPFSDHISPYFP